MVAVTYNRENMIDIGCLWNMVVHLNILPDILGASANLEFLRLPDKHLMGSLTQSLGRSRIHYLWLNNQDLASLGPIDPCQPNISIPSPGRLMKLWHF